MMKSQFNEVEAYRFGHQMTVHLLYSASIRNYGVTRTTFKFGDLVSKKMQNLESATSS